MKSESEISSPELESFDQWLAKPTIQARSGMLTSVRRQIDEEDQTWEMKLDSLFAQDPSLTNPHMASHVREKISDSSEQNKVIWFQWLTPVAAALVLGLAFFSFQTKAPAPEDIYLADAKTDLSMPAELENDPEITRIFALAANLQGTSDMSRLQSVDDLALLFE